jgi:hypothetical protein
MSKRESPKVLSLIRGMLALRDKTGRDLAIVGASWLEAVVEQNLRENMQVYAGKAPDRAVFERALKSSEQKILVAAGFGLISNETLKAALLVNKVRNAFAHTIEDLTCDSPTIASNIAQMKLSMDMAMESVTINQSAANAPVEGITFDGERFEDVSGIFDVNPWRVFFFLPNVPAATNDDRLRNQIFACALGAAGLGLKPWLLRELPAGLPGVDIEFAK